MKGTELEGNKRRETRERNKTLWKFLDGSQ